MKSVLFIGGLGFRDTAYCGGMLAKNRQFVEYLRSRSIRLMVIDTYRYDVFNTGRLIGPRGSRFLRDVSCLLHGFFYDEIIISDHAYRVIELLHIFGLSKKTTFFVIGGEFARRLSGGSLQPEYFMGLKKIFVETYEMRDDLTDLGFRSVERAANFKSSPPLEIIKDHGTKHPIRLLYVGRINREKGIDLAIDALSLSNKDSALFTLDFYGPVDKSYEKSFFDKLSGFDFLSYGGCLDLFSGKKDYEKLLGYDVFIFPTFWPGEGFPGALIDAFILGLPVLASDWNYNAEIINDGYNGILFRAGDVHDMAAKLNYMLQNKSMLAEMGSNSRLSAEEYKTENVLSVLDEILT